MKSSGVETDATITECWEPADSEEVRYSTAPGEETLGLNRFSASSADEVVMGGEVVVLA